MIMARFRTGKSLPCCWALLPNKKEETYQMMWDAILNKINKDGAEDHKPEKFSIDFEAASIKVLYFFH